MNRLIFPNGGMPFELDDLDFMQEATKDAIKGLLHEFARQNNGNIILSGCEVSANAGNPSNFDISEGYIMLDYEVLRFDGIANITTGQPYFELDISYDPAGNDVFFDNISRDTYEVRKAIHNITQPSGTYVRLLDTNRLIAFMKSALLEPDIEWGQAYVDAANKTLDLSKDVNGNAFADPKANYSKKYIFVKTTGLKLIERIIPYPESLIAREYVIVPSTGTLRFLSGSGGFFIGDFFSGEFIEVKQNESIKIVSTKGVHAGGVFPLDTWRVEVGEAATLTKVNYFRRSLIQKKGTATWAGVAANALLINLDGNAFEVDTNSQRTIDYISSLGVGAKITLVATGQPFLINNNTAGAPSSYKPIILPDGKSLDANSNNGSVSLVELDTHWRFVGVDKKRSLTTVSYTLLGLTNASLSSGEVKYSELGGGMMLVSFALTGNVGTGNPNFIAFSIPNVIINADTYGSCSFFGSNTGATVLEMSTNAINNTIRMSRPNSVPFANNENLAIVGQLIINATVS